MKTVLIDTNALMSITELKIDLFSEVDKACLFPHTIAVLSGTLQELEKIKQEQRHKYKKAASIALQLLKAKQVVIIPSREGSSVDDALTALSLRGDLVLTQDRELKKRLTKPYLTIRQKKMVIIVE